MKQILVNNKEKIIRLISAVLFLIILVKVFLSVTYLFRGNQYNYDDRISVVGIKEEKEDSLDVIYIGGSAAFAYWQPLKAYHDYGFTSYDLATNTLQAESILAYIKYAQKYQNPDLYIIGVRPFQYYEEEGTEVGLRVTSDALDIGINRTELIKNYIDNHSMDTDEFALYWDITKYHTNHDALKAPEAWRLMDNSYRCNNKGHQIQAAWCYLEEPQNFQTDHRTDLLPNDEKTLIELLEYLKKNNLNALFVVCPYSITEEHYSIYNTVGDMVSGYGYDFLNTNDYYREMEADFSKDFYNKNHMNALGAEAYTEFLGKYLTENYHLPDHRSDREYDEWGELSDAFAYTEEACQNGVLGKIAYADEGIAIGEAVRSLNDFLSWGPLVNDERYTLAVVGDASEFNNLSVEYKKVLSQMGLSGCYGEDSYINFANGDGRTSVTVEIGQVQQKVPCTIENSNHECSIMINNVEYSCRRKEALNIVVFDNYYRTIVDSVYLIYNNGDLLLGR